MVIKRGAVVPGRISWGFIHGSTFEGPFFNFIWYASTTFEDPHRNTGVYLLMEGRLCEQAIR